MKLNKHNWIVFLLVFITPNHALPHKIGRGAALSFKGDSRWIFLILMAFLLSGAPRVGQILTNACHENYYLYLFLSYFIGAAILVVISLRRRDFNPSSLTWGTGCAVASYTGVFCTLKALELLNPHVVFPISLAGPIILGIILSLFVFREKITRMGWVGVSSGVTGILILAIWK